MRAIKDFYKRFRPKNYAKHEPKMSLSKCGVEHNIYFFLLILPDLWRLAIVITASKKIYYHDSMGRRNQRCLRKLINFVNQHHIDQYNTPFIDWQTQSDGQ